MARLLHLLSNFLIHPLLNELPMLFPEYRRVRSPGGRRRRARCVVSAPRSVARSSAVRVGVQPASPADQARRRSTAAPMEEQPDFSMERAEEIPPPRSCPPKLPTAPYDENVRLRRKHLPPSLKTHYSSRPPAQSRPPWAGPIPVRPRGAAVRGLREQRLPRRPLPPASSPPRAPSSACSTRTRATSTTTSFASRRRLRRRCRRRSRSRSSSTRARRRTTSRCGWHARTPAARTSTASTAPTTATAPPRSPSPPTPSTPRSRCPTAP